MKLLGLIILIILLVILGPLLSIWSLNTLFPALAIPYTWQTWLAIALIGTAFKSDVSVKK